MCDLAGGPYFFGNWRSMQRNGGCLEEGLVFGAHLEGSCDEDVVSIELQVDSIEDKRPLHNQHVQPGRRHVENDRLACAAKRHTREDAPNGAVVALLT